MRDLKRRISKLEDQIGYLKTDWKRTTVGLNQLRNDMLEILKSLSDDHELLDSP